MRREKTMNSGQGRTAERLVLGVVGGIAATWAMTLAMNVLFRRLPEKEQYPLPPREITETLLPARAATSEQSMAAYSLAAHAAYGAAAGGVFTLSGLHQHRPLLRGMAWGVGVWSGSYLGWLPLAHVLKPADAHPLRRNFLMIVAHLVWGGGLGLVVCTLKESMTPLRKDRWPLLQDVDGRRIRR